MRRSLKWTTEHRTVLHLLHTKTNYERETAAQTFNHLFAAELQSAGYPEGIEPRRLQDEYNARFRDGRSKAWLPICNEEQSAEELQYRERLLQRINTAATAVGAQSADSEPPLSRTFIANTRATPARPAKKQKRMSKDMSKVETKAQGNNLNVSKQTLVPHSSADKQPDTQKKILKLSKPSDNGDVSTASDTNTTEREPPAHTASRQPAKIETSNGEVKMAGNGPPDIHLNKEDNPEAIGNNKNNATETDQTPALDDPNLTHSVTGKTTQQILGDLEKTIDNAYGGIEAPDDGRSLPTDLGDREVQAWEAYRDKVYAETGSHLRRDITGPPLEMIHHSTASTIWKGDVPHTLSSTFITHKDPVYQLGGKVFRAGIDSDEQDVMICDQNQCARCKFGRNDDKVVIVGESKTEGLPFVHASDFYATPGTGFHYLPKAKAYDSDYPKRMWKTNVAFWDGKQREVMVCEAGVCEHCSGTDVVAKKAARYRPGGDLYELKKAQERALKT